MKRRFLRRRGFTLIELLVTVSIITILLGLLLPAVQAARESARRARCAKNLGEMMRAVHNYETGAGVFPSINTFNRFGSTDNDISVTSMHVALLPYLEQSALHAQLNLNVNSVNIPGFLSQNQTVATTTLSQFLCPSDGNTTARPYACVSYRASEGPGGYDRVSSVPLRTWLEVPRWTGPFSGPGGDVPAAAVLDGFSNTIGFSEKRVGSEGRGYDPRNDWIELPLVNGQPDDWINLCSNLTDDSTAHTDGGRRWLFPSAGYTNFFTIAPPNSPIPDCGFQALGWYGLFTARSNHPGGVNAALVDGSVRWFASTVHASLWRSYGTRSGQEVVADE